MGGGYASYWTDRLSILRRTNGSDSWGSGRVPSRPTERAGRLVAVSGSVGGCSGAFVVDLVTWSSLRGWLDQAFLMGRLSRLFSRWPYYNLANRSRVSYVTF